MGDTITDASGIEFIIEDDLSVTDDKGTRWTPDSYTTADGGGDTFGPNHPNPPLVIQEMRTKAPKKK